MSRDPHKACNNNPKEFRLIPKGLPPNLDYDHVIHLQLKCTKHK